MFFALDANGNRVYAEDGVFSGCVCPACGNPVQQRRGDINKHHFAHLKYNALCPYDYNADYKHMSEWHIRMQGYFPKEEREYIFTDKETGEKHIADVYIKEANTVLEFQYSSIKQKEFLNRTMFHLKEGRRLVWLFDESWKNPDEEAYNKRYYKNGKLTKANNPRAAGPYKTKSFQWLYRRKFVEEGPPVYQPNYSVCLYTGTEGDVFHRIISLESASIILSLHNITMFNNLNVDELFYPEGYWQESEPWKSEFEREEKKVITNFERVKKRYKRPFQDYETGQTCEIPPSLWNKGDEFIQRYLSFSNDYKPKESTYEVNYNREDYLYALISDFESQGRDGKNQG